MHIWKKALDLPRLNERGKNTMAEVLGIEFTAFDDDSLTARMPVDARTIQPMGIMHGGASCALAETVGSTAANFCLDEGYYCVGLDINVNHLRAMRNGFVIATAKPFHLGRSTQVWGINIVNEEGKMVSVSRLTMAVLSN